MRFSWRRVGALFRKELRDYRHNRFVIATMAFLPLLFVILPTIQLPSSGPRAGSNRTALPPCSEMRKPRRTTGLTAGAEPYQAISFSGPAAVLIAGPRFGS